MHHSIKDSHVYAYRFDQSSIDQDNRDDIERSEDDNNNGKNSKLEYGDVNIQAKNNVAQRQPTNVLMSNYYSLSTDMGGHHKDVSKGTSIATKLNRMLAKQNDYIPTLGYELNSKYQFRYNEQDEIKTSKTQHEGFTIDHLGKRNIHLMDPLGFSEARENRRESRNYDPHHYLKEVNSPNLLLEQDRERRIQSLNERNNETSRLEYDRQSRAWNEAIEGSHTDFPIVKAASKPPIVKEGDWHCSSCNNINWARRFSCNL